MAASQQQALVDIYKKMPTPEIEHRLERGGLTMLARLVAETELADRKSRSQAESMAASQEQTLTESYKAKPTHEIESRLQSGELTMLEKLVADAELADRKNRPRTEPVVAGKGDTRTGKQVALGIIGGSLLIGATAYWLMSSELFTLITFSLLIGVAMVLGKAFPGFGMSVGALLTASPVLLGAYLWHDGALTPKGGDYRPLGALIAWGFLLFAAIIAISLGSALIRGARHEGSWGKLEDDITREREKALDGMRKLD
ncbi:MAG: hypothetical protein H6R14_1183 [Proteobacteria bacterium]|nr:hypothetical protein [Pseudomonadota bacterium]